MKHALTLAAIVAAFTVLTARADEPKTVHWHFPGADGTPAPESVTDTSGELTMNRYQLGAATGRVLTDQVTQNDDVAGTHMWWKRDGEPEIFPRPSGSVQMFRYELTNDVPKIRHSAYYTLDDSSAVKTLFPTNASGDLLPFTVEVVFKAYPMDFDAFSGTSTNFHLLTISRGTRTTSVNTVFRLASISTGALQLQCESKNGGNGNVCNIPTVTSADYRDGEWHHLAMAYSLDETKEPHQGTVRVYLDGTLKKEYAFTNHTTIRSLKYTETADGAVVENAAYFSVGSVDNKGVHLSVSELRVTQAALGPEEFVQFGNKEGLKERFSGTIARWTFDAQGQSGETVGSQYGAITAAEGVEAWELCGATWEANVSIWENRWTAGGDYPPLFTNDVPCAYVWDPGAGRVVNPENATSVFFRHESEDRASNQSSKGSTLHTRNNLFHAPDLISSNFTVECFVKPDKTFGDNVSCVMSVHKEHNLVVGINLISGQTPRVLYYGSGNSTQYTISSEKNISTDGGWHHLAVNYDASSGTSMVVKLWLDYEFRGEKETLLTPVFSPSRFNVVFGAGGGVFAFSGMIDEPRISVGDIGPERFLRAFVPREDLTSVWLVPTNSVVSGDEWYSPETSWLRGAWTNGAVSLSSDLPADNTVLRFGGKNVPLYGSVEFSGAGGITVPCAALTGTNVFTVEANFCGAGEVFAKKTFPGHDAWAVGADEDGFAYVELNGVRTTTAVQAGDGCWHHVALAVDRASAKSAVLYVDGVAVETVDASAMTVDAGDFVIGEGFDGSIVGVRFSAGVPPKKFFVARPPYGTVLTVR